MLYYCGESTAPRARVAYTTARPALVEALAEAGIPPSRVLDAHDLDDLEARVRDIASGEAGKLPMSPAGGSGGGGGGGGVVALPGMAGLRSPVRLGGGETESTATPPPSDDSGFSKPAAPGRRPPAGARALPFMTPPK